MGVRLVPFGIRAHPKLYLLAHSLQIIQLAWQSFVMMYVPCLHLSAIDQSIAK